MGIDPMLTVPEGYAFDHETRWSRVYRKAPIYEFRASKFRTGEASITLEELERESSRWTSDERVDFMGAFYSDDLAFSREVFHFYISQAEPKSRYRFSAVFPMNRDVNEAFSVLSDWMTDPETDHRHCLLVAVVTLAPTVGKREAVSLVERILEQETSDGVFWRQLPAASYEKAKLVTECLAALGWLGKGEFSVPLLERIAAAGIRIISDRASQLVESAREGKWSVS